MTPIQQAIAILEEDALTNRIERALEVLRGVPQSPPEPTAEMINAAAREMWNDRDARHGGQWEGRDAQEICVIQTKATARAALMAALSISRPLRQEETK